MDFSGKTAIVTGAAAGLGRAIAQALHQRGANLALAGLHEDTVTAFARELDPQGQRTLAIGADVSDHRAMHAMVDDTLERFGGLDYAVNNAGITGPHGHDTADYPIEDWNRVIAVDVNGTFYAMKAELAAMRETGHGAIVNLSSANGIVGIPGTSAYTTAKHAVIGLTRTAALEYAKAGIRINAIGPGYAATERMLETPREVLDMFAQTMPMGRLAKPAEIAAFVCFLLSDEASFATGGFFPVDGGYTAQ
ncbi:SDR family NAD(P)-dependent oxidoreductase [Devosia nitrariae]|uniref:Short-chain dehydrogenase n=1 Tax=Devosia nitrariae TaxID=2071872 RepID=A0ABQ5VYH2_9HYPH|nr:SDR family NAD(P)-dependent oxidoreductase [Devosia nitrariae]GLQ52862.1 short-chain dehydrogenase [Devosia nitrariae]